MQTNCPETSTEISSQTRRHHLTRSDDIKGCRGTVRASLVKKTYTDYTRGSVAPRSGRLCMTVRPIGSANAAAVYTAGHADHVTARKRSAAGVEKVSRPRTEVSSARRHRRG